MSGHHSPGTILSASVNGAKKATSLNNPNAAKDKVTLESAEKSEAQRMGDPVVLQQRANAASALASFLESPPKNQADKNLQSEMMSKYVSKNLTSVKVFGYRADSDNVSRMNEDGSSNMVETEAKNAAVLSHKTIIDGGTNYTIDAFSVMRQKCKEAIGPDKDVIEQQIKLLDEQIKKPLQHLSRIYPGIDFQTIKEQFEKNNDLKEQLHQAAIAKSESLIDSNNKYASPEEKAAALAEYVAQSKIVTQLTQDLGRVHFTQISIDAINEVIKIQQKQENLKAVSKNLQELDAFRQGNLKKPENPGELKAYQQLQLQAMEIKRAKEMLGHLDTLAGDTTLRVPREPEKMIKSFSIHAKEYATKADKLDPTGVTRNIAGKSSSASHEESHHEQQVEKAAVKQESAISSFWNAAAAAVSNVLFESPQPAVAPVRASSAPAPASVVPAAASRVSSSFDRDFGSPTGASSTNVSLAAEIEKARANTNGLGPSLSTSAPKNR